MTLVKSEHSSKQSREKATESGITTFSNFAELRKSITLKEQEINDRRSSLKIHRDSDNDLTHNHYKKSEHNRENTSVHNRENGSVHNRENGSVHNSENTNEHNKFVYRSFDKFYKCKNYCEEYKTKVKNETLQSMSECTSKNESDPGGKYKDISISNKATISTIVSNENTISSSKSSTIPTAENEKSSDKYCYIKFKKERQGTVKQLKEYFQKIQDEKLQKRNNNLFYKNNQKFNNTIREKNCANFFKSKDTTLEKIDNYKKEFICEYIKYENELMINNGYNNCECELGVQTTHDKYVEDGALITTDEGKEKQKGISSISRVSDMREVSRHNELTGTGQINQLSAKIENMKTEEKELLHSLISEMKKSLCNDEDEGHISNSVEQLEDSERRRYMITRILDILKIYDGKMPSEEGMPKCSHACAHFFQLEQNKMGKKGKEGEMVEMVEKDQMNEKDAKNESCIIPKDFESLQQGHIIEQMKEEKNEIDKVISTQNKEVSACNAPLNKLKESSAYHAKIKTTSEHCDTISSNERDSEIAMNNCSYINTNIKNYENVVEKHSEGKNTCKGNAETNISIKNHTETANCHNINNTYQNKKRFSKKIAKDNRIKKDSVNNASKFEWFYSTLDDIHKGKIRVNGVKDDLMEYLKDDLTDNINGGGKEYSSEDSENNDLFLWLENRDVQNVLKGEKKIVDEGVP
ncbi:conserved Plasmodium protein, unknown function [Plasmodium malariae]|uniref:Uncharacterized protein n=1 Tax=Plasmodium malariae TaxID=5858 RepID=A0A1A8WW11_PLAMA|nr:conserved Plasmodium protein, unknown function [Plasmodium malariae]